VKLLTIAFLIWVAPAFLVLLAMTWSLWPRKKSREEGAAERPVLSNAAIAPSAQEREGHQHEQPGRDDERKMI
jgi:hypothetical protein